MSLNDVTLPIAVLKVLADEITARLTAVKEAGKTTFTETGADRATASLPDGTPVASVTLAGAGRLSASVTDPNALREWVEDNHPGQIVTSVRDGYLKHLLDAAVKEGRAVDPKTGELVPGITVGESSAYLSVRFKTGGREAVIAAWRAGKLAHVDVVEPLALPSAQEGSEAAA